MNVALNRKKVAIVCPLQKMESTATCAVELNSREYEERKKRRRRRPLFFSGRTAALSNFTKRDRGRRTREESLDTLDIKPRFIPLRPFSAAGLNYAFRFFLHHLLIKLMVLTNRKEEEEAAMHSPPHSSI